MPIGIMEMINCDDRSSIGIANTINKNSDGREVDGIT
jgi:hypothetical protein